MENLMIPKKEQIFGECRLKPIEKRGTAAFITDYAILNGGHYSIDDNTLKNNGSYFLNYYEKIKNQGILNYVDEFGGIERGYITKGVGIRPILNFSEICRLYPNLKIATASDGVLEVLFGEYLQMAAASDMQNELNNIMLVNQLSVTKEKREKLKEIMGLEEIIKTDYSYTRNTYRYNPFYPETIPVYEYRKRKFAKVVANTMFFNNCNFELENLEEYKNGDAVWVEEQPIKWLVSEKEDVMISEKIIQAGIRFDKDDCLMYMCIPQYYQTEMKKYTDKYLEKEIFREDYVYQKKVI